LLDYPMTLLTLNLEKLIILMPSSNLAKISLKLLSTIPMIFLNPEKTFLKPLSTILIILLNPEKTFLKPLSTIPMISLNLKK
jgi:hypothetical protein